MVNANTIQMIYYNFRCKLYINTRKEHLESNPTILKHKKNNKL